MKLPETYLIERFKPEAKHILELLTKTKDAQENKAIQSYYNKLADWGSKHLQKAGEIVLDKIDLSYKDEVIKLGLVKRTKDLWSMINTLIELMKKHGLNEEKAKIIQQTTLEILAELSKIPKPEPEPEPEPDPKSGKCRDWTAYRAEKLANANGKPTSEVLKDFYDEYYSVEYAGIAPAKEQEIVAKLKSLDKILIPEFNRLGYNPEVNPFAQFLKILIEKKFNIFTKLTTNNYGAIHNSFIEKHVTGNMLGNYNEGNILFCDDLYGKNGLDIVEYLSLQGQALKKAEADNKYSDVKSKLIAILFIIQPGQKDYYKENIENLLSKDTKLILPDNKDAKVKSLLEVQELYRHIFKTGAEKTKKKVDFKTVEDIVDEAESQNIILDMIKLILAQNEYAGSVKYAEEAQKIDDWLDKHNYTYTKDNIAKSRKILLDYTLDTRALSTIIKNLKNRIDEQTENKN